MAEPLRTCLLVHELGRSGGMAVIASHARALADDGRFAPELVVTGPPRGGLPAEHEGVPVRAAADAGEYDLAVATWWETVPALFELRARRRLVFLQSLEERFYPERDFTERMGAAAVLTLPVHFVTVASWLRDVLAELRPDAGCVVVPNGIDKALFAPRPPRPGGGPLRVLVEGQPTLWFKGVRESVAAVRAMSEPATLTLVAPDGDALEDLDADRRLSGLDAPAMAELYAEHDVLLKLSRVESLGLPPLEAFHVGRPCVLAPFTGHEEYAEHGGNCLIVGFDDEPGTARALDLLARDGGLRARLAEGALRTAAGWPSTEDAGRAFAEALLELRELPPAGADAAATELQRALRRWIEVGRHHPDHVRAQLTRREGELLDLRIRFGELEQRIESIADERAYRFAKALRGLLPGRER